MNPDFTLVTVILPVYNTEKYIEQAINSICRQTYTNMEILVIDDASTDKTLSIVKGLSLQDLRIICIEKDKNTGYTQSLNMGLELAKGVFIARMDADDKAHPERIAKQVSYMNQHPECVMCGTAYQLMHNGHLQIPPLKHSEIMTELLYGNVFCHPSVMMRKSTLQTHSLKYDPTMEPSEDYALWTALSKYGNLANLPESLLEYRIHTGSVSKSREEIQHQKANLIRLTFIRETLMLFKGDFLLHLNRFWFSVCLLIESLVNKKIPIEVAWRKVIGNRHKIFS